MHENSPDEIRDLVLEYLENVNHTKVEFSDLQNQVNTLRKLQAHRIFKAKMYADKSDDIYNKYRFASRVEAFCGTLGKNYLEANWNICSKN